MAMALFTGRNLDKSGGIYERKSFVNSKIQLGTVLPSYQPNAAHVGISSAGFEAVHGGFRYGSRNQKGEEVLDFAIAFDLMIANTFFRKRVPFSDL